MAKIIEDITKIYPDGSMTVISYKTPFLVDSNGAKSKKTQLSELEKVESLSEDLIPYSDTPRNFTQWRNKIEQFKAEQSLDRSLRRTKSNIKDLILCNDFDLWVTFTFNPKKVKSRYNFTMVSHAFQNEIRRLRRQFGYFAYIVVPEHHKDDAFHFHGLIKGYTGKIMPAYTPRKLSELKREGCTSVFPAIDANGKHIKNNKGTLLYHNGVQIRDNGRLCYNMTDYKLGHTTVKIIEKTNESLHKLANYTTKYITKDMPVFTDSRKRLWATVGLLRPIIKHNQKKQLTKDLKSTSFYENEHQIIERFNDVFDDILVKK